MPLQPPALRALTLLSLLALACSSEGDSGSSAAAGTQSTSGRFQDCGGDTMLDTGRNLQWEIKSDTFVASADTFKGCDSQAVHSFARTCPDTRSAMNRYTYCDNSDNRTANCDACQRGISNVRQHLGPRRTLLLILSRGNVKGWPLRHAGASLPRPTG